MNNMKLKLDLAKWAFLMWLLKVEFKIAVTWIKAKTIVRYGYKEYHHLWYDTW